MVSSCVAFAALLRDLGLNAATIYRTHISHAQLSALFYLSVGFNVLLALVVAVLAPVVAWFFNEPRLAPLTAAFGLVGMIAGAQSQQIAILTRGLRFKTLATIDALAATASTIAGVSIAWLTLSYWALFAAAAASAFVSFIAVWIVCEFRPGRPSFENAFKEFISFGSSVSGFNIVNYFARNADNLLIGRYYGPGQLGFYDRAYQLLVFPLSQIQLTLGRVMVPLLARLKTEPIRYYSAYTECISLVMMATQPGLIFAVVFAADVIQILFGPYWMPAAPIFKWLGIAGIHQVMTSTVGWLYISQGRGSEYFRVGMFGATVTVASFILGLHWGALGVAIAYTIINYLAIVPVSWWAAGQKGPVTTRDLYLVALPHFIGTLGSALVLATIAQTTTTQNIFTCALLCLLSYAVYLAIILWFPSKRNTLVRNLQYCIKSITS